MDSPEDGNSLQCETSLECQSSKPSVVDAEVQLDLNDDCQSENEDLNANFQNGFADLNMKLPVTVQNCVPAGLQELVVITNTGTNFLNDQKLPLTTFQSDNEPLSKRLCIEQDGQTYILSLQDGMDGLTGVMEIQQKSFSPVENLQVINCPEVNSLQCKQGINQNWFTSREEKTTLHNKGHMWKQGMWAKEEVELLENNIRQYCEEHDVNDPATIVFEMSKDERKDFYRTVAKGLNRPLFSVYRRVLRMYDDKNHVGKYTTAELEKLKKLRSVYGNDWQAIGSAMGRSASSIKDRCRLMKDNCNQGKWLPAEERRLAEAVYELANALPGEMISTGLSWAVVAERVSTRSEKQCRTKWLNYLNWKVAGGTEWTREDDVTLICRVYALNATDENQVDWAELAKGWLSVRSPQWLRGKWWSLKRHVPCPALVSFQEICEYLYQQFVLKAKLKEEQSDSFESTSDSLDMQTAQIFSGPKSTILQTVTLSTSPPPTGIVVAATAQACTAPVISLTDAQCVDMVNSAGNLTSVRMTPMIHTLEVLPQNIQLANTQTFLLATPGQQTLPLTTTISPNQIIIQTMTAEDLHRNENITVEINTAPHIILNSANPTTLTSLASTQMPSAPPSPNCEEVLVDTSSSLIEQTFDSETVDENSNLHQGVEIEESHVSSHTCKNNSPHLILSDPMLAVISDTESDKLHGTEDILYHTSATDV